MLKQNKKQVSLGVAYLALSSVIFLFTLGLNYFKTFENSDIKWAEKIAGFPQKKYRVEWPHLTKSKYVRVLELSMWDRSDRHYLETSLRIVNDLKKVGVKVVLLECPSVDLNDKYKALLERLNSTGIVVFGRQSSFDPLWDDEPYAEHPYYGLLHLPWGAYTLQHDICEWKKVHHTDPRSVHKVFLKRKYVIPPQILAVSKDSVPDVLFEVIKKYRGFADTLVPEIKGTEAKFGDYVFPVLKDGSFLVKDHYDWWEHFISPVRVREGELSNTFQYQPIYSDTTQSLDHFKDDFIDKVVILMWTRDVGIGKAQAMYSYTAAIENFLTHNFTTRVEFWHLILALLGIIFVAFVSKKMRPLRAVLIVFFVLVGLVAVYVWLYEVQNILIEAAYPVFAAVLSLATFPAIKLAYENKTAEEERRKLELELEKKKLVEAQKEQLEIEVADRTKELRQEKEETERLLYNILPVEIAKELREKGMTTPRRYEEISILFTDFRGFTNTVATMPAGKLVEELNDIFQHIDDIIDKHGIEKIKTIGDSYMIAAGLPKESENHALQCVKAAIEMLRFIEKRNETSAMKWQMRVGIHSGTVVAGVVGKRKFTYDVWGDTVNIASRMQTSGEPGRINISAYTYDLIKQHFECEYRGKVDAKGKGEIDMYFVKKELSS